jgi:type IV secretion system protein VirD4
MGKQPPEDHLAEVVAVTLVGAGACGGGTGLLLWLSGQLSAVLSGHGWPDSSPGHDLVPILRAWKDSPGDPARAWPPALSGLIGAPWLVYLVLCALLAGSALLVFWAIRLGLNWRRRRGLRIFRLGFASGMEIRRLLGRRAVLRRSQKARPQLAGQRSATPLDVGFFLGRDYRSRQRLYGSVEDAVLIVAPPRGGKDVHFCTPFTLDAPGACVVVSTGVEAFTTTYEHRAALGDVYVFDPNRLTNWPHRLRWSPVRGCEHPDTADDRAKIFVKQAGYKIGDEGSSSVVTSAVIVLRCYLHAAALHGLSIRDVVRWAREPTDPEPVELLRRAQVANVAAPGWADELAAAVATDPQTRGARWAAVVQSMSCLFDATVQEECSPRADEVLDVRAFVAGRNTLYLLGKERGTNPVAPLLSIMVESLWGQMTRTAARMPGGRLEPPVSFEINEAAFVMPAASLPRYMGLLGKSSIGVHVYLRSLSQARDKWDTDGAAAMWDHAAIRIIAGSGGNIDDLEEVSQLLGDIHLPSGKSLGRRVLTADEIRVLPFGRALVVANMARPVEVRLTPWWARKDGKQIAAAKARTEAAILEHSERAEHTSQVQRYVRAHTESR